MLNSFRNLANTWYGKILGVFLLIGLAGFGISNVIFDFGSTTVAQVGSEEISVRDFQRAYTNDLNRFTQQVGRMPSPEEALAMGLPSATLGRLASDAAIANAGREFGLGVSDDRLGLMLRQDPSFSGTLGQFDRQRFLQVLQQSGLTEAEYFEMQANAARRQQMAAALFAEIGTPETALELITRYGGDTRTLDYFVLNEQSIPAVAEPTEEEIAAYLEEHQQSFRAPETRTVDILSLSPEILAETLTISEEEIAAEYESTRDQRVQQEQRRIVQVPLTTEEMQEAFETAAADGTPFSEVAAATGATPTELGLLNAAGITDAALAAAAFKLEEGDFTIIPGIGGQRAVTVTEIVPEGVTSLAEARDDIAATLALRQARQDFLDVLDQIEELRAAFQPLRDIADRFDLPIEQVTLTESGAALADTDIPPDEYQRVTQAVFSADPDRLSPTIVVASNHNIWFELGAIEPERDRTLDEVREEVIAAILEERTAAALNAEVERVLDRLEAGVPFADVAAEVNQFPQLSQPISRSGGPGGSIGQAVASAAFSGGEGSFGSAVNGDGDHVVFQVVEVTPAPDAMTDEAVAFLEETLRNTLYSDFVTGLRDAAGVRVNNQTLNRVISPDTAVP